ncbi:MAG TPA: fluoride efflux transporter CrcB [Candidatus Thalassarchaeaceae archaeon]|jgi:CrcB protein|nr:fluoride efflux transporter CrcB [Euryarchaeota archaeon]MDP6378982.1 fluoride efflux transporter CrcB [Candidatus Thalassarchaeaceae archaeon]DAC50898.1 MAG TPA: fluoride efflux transporter CrcB [Candidatus Poseidoniales archaeon]HIH82844.1 fluoride efflux transporter CrcB [Candidatus Thalassarchaeaceae archaeon]|tara:strand:+ start:250 stop:624 length:375 start_codon:yes stop_codon:yes gene_type:complete
MEPKALLLVAVGGACGAVARYAITEWIPSDFPWGTLVVNVLGSFLLGILIAVGITNEQVTPEILLLVGTGALGAFTTMSTFSVDAIQLIDSGEHMPALSYMLANFILCPLFAFVGWRYIPTILG